MSAAVYALMGLDAAAVYTLEDAETGASLGEATGAQLMTEGLSISLAEKRTASLIFVTRK